MRNIKRFIASFLLAATLFLGACSDKDADEDEPPPDALTPANERIDNIQQQAEDMRYHRLYDAQIARVKAERLRKERDERLEAERLRRDAERNDHRAQEISRGSSTSANEAQTYEATFYHAHCSTGCTGVTATGLDVSNTIYSLAGHRIIAVDPSRIALGSLVEVTLADGSTFRAVAEDTGGDIKGDRIDVLVGSRAEAYRLGRQTAQVRIIRKGR